MPGQSETTPSLRLYCPACKQSYRVRNADASKKYSCKSCKGVLQVMAEPAETISMSPGLRESDELSPTVLDRRIQNSIPPLKPIDDELRLQGEPKTQAADVMRLLPQSFQGYTVIKELARGGMGAVLLADQSELRRKVAMKIILPWAGSSDPSVQQRFMREARAMAKLKHPHIIQVYDVGEINGLSFLAMEFIEGQTLSDLIAGNRLDIPATVTLTSKVARALAYAHAQGIIHRDIKPANVMVRSSGEPVLMDFGLAKDFDSESIKLSVTGNIMGTPSYMSPEQAQGLPLDERSDLYSLGAVLYEALTREAPFDGDTTIATIYNVVHKTARPASDISADVPPDLSRICMKALEKDPTDRYQSMDLFAADLDRFGAGMVINAKGPSLARKTIEFSRTNRASFGGIIAALCLLAIVGVVLKMGWLRFGKTEADELRNALTGGSPETRVLHVRALGGDLREKKIEPGTPEHADALAALRLAAGDDDGNGVVAAAAAEMIADAGDKGAEDVLRKQLDPQRPVNVRLAAIAALKRLSPQALTTILADVIRKDTEMDARLAAVEALPDVVPPDVMVYLIKLAVKNDPPALSAAANRKLSLVRPPQSILASYAGGKSAVIAPKISEMIETSRTYEQQLEEAFADTTPQSKTARKALPYELAAKKLLSEDPARRVEAAYDLGIIADGRAEPALIRALLDSEGDVALAAAESLGKLPRLQAPQKLASLLTEPSPASRLAVARAYGLVKTAPPGAALGDALVAEKIGPVQAEMATALGRMKFAGGVTPLLATLSTGTPEAARQAAWALGQIGDKSACAGLVDALGRAGNDKALSEEIAGALSAITGKAIGPDEEKWRKALK